MASRVTFKNWDPDALLVDAPARIVREYGELIAPQLQQSVAAVAYPWPRATRRAIGRSGLGDPISGGGRLVSKGLRDIIDTGTLQDSQQGPTVSPERNGASMRIVWGAPYSLEVLEGSSYVNSKGAAVELPGRDWITPVLDANPPVAYVTEQWQRLAGRR